MNSLRHERRRRRRCVARPAHLARAVSLALAALTPALQAQDVQLDGGSALVARGAAITLQLSQQLAARASDLRVLVGGIDVSALVRFPAPGRMFIDTRALRLASGESEVVVYVLEDKAWNELARLPLKLLTRGGFESAAFTPKLDLAGKSQFAETTRGSAGAPPRPHYADLTGRGSVAFNAARGAFGIDGSFNAAGSSYRPEALRFGERGVGAQKADLAEYSVNAKYGSTSLSAGHLSYGNNPLLLSGFASRGLTLAQKLGERTEVSVNAMNGTAIVGFDNPLGLNDFDHRVVSGTVGHEFFARAGALRAEVIYMDASIESRQNFNVGEIPDAEKSRGLGLRLAGATESNRLRGEAVFGRSTYVNPFDPALAQGGPSQAVRPVTANGYTVEMSGDLVRNARLLGEKHPLTLTATLRHERIAPLFKSLGASISSDTRVDRGALALAAGGAQLQITRQRQQDNLDDIPTILKTRTETTSVTAAAPLPQWFGADTAKSWWPALNASWQRVHQLALNTPVTADSGFAASHRPDQLSTSQQFGLNWNRGAWNWGYSLTHSDQDNRQPGRERADFTTLGQALNLAVRATDNLGLTLGIQRNRQDSREKALVTYTKTGSAGFDWRLFDRWTIAANYSRTLGDDSRVLARNANRSAQAQLAYRFEVAQFGVKLPGQVFVRYSDQASNRSDTVFGLASAGGNRAWDAGLSLSFF